MPRNSAFELQRTFEKFAEGGLSRKCNFGRALTHAIRDGFLEAALVAEILQVEPALIRKTGNCMKPREIQRTSEAILKKVLF
jgi:hypothetical protein